MDPASPLISDFAASREARSLARAGARVAEPRLPPEFDRAEQAHRERWQAIDNAPEE